MGQKKVMMLQVLKFLFQPEIDEIHGAGIAELRYGPFKKIT
jgi:hypothetical protein